MSLFQLFPGRCYLRLVAGLLMTTRVFPALASDKKVFDVDPYQSWQTASKVEQDLLKTIQTSNANAKTTGTKLSNSLNSSAVTSYPQATFSETVVDQTKSEDEIPEFSRLVRQETTMMPDGGSYGASANAMQQFKKSITLNEKGGIEVKSNNAKPSFCSSATYLVFLSVIADCQDLGKISTDKGINHKFLVHSQPDGVGVWGRWNANGPGTAILVKELGIGENFLDLKKAVPGDFLKVWWTKEIGAKEHGHSVVFLGSRTDDAGESYLKFWSSNIPGGYGVKEVPMSRVKNLLFSRITNPKAIQNVNTIQSTNNFLASMISRTVTMEDVKKELGIK